MCSRVRQALFEHRARDRPHACTARPKAPSGRATSKMRDSVPEGAISVSVSVCLCLCLCVCVCVCVSWERSPSCLRDVVSGVVCVCVTLCVCVAMPGRLGMHAAQADVVAGIVAGATAVLPAALSASPTPTFDLRPPFFGSDADSAAAIGSSSLPRKHPEQTKHVYI